MFWLLVMMQLCFAFLRNVLVFFCLGLSLYIKQLLISFLFSQALPSVLAIPQWGTQTIGSCLGPLEVCFHNCFAQRHLGKHKWVIVVLSRQPWNDPTACLAAQAAKSISPSYSPKAGLEILILLTKREHLLGTAEILSPTMLCLNSGSSPAHSVSMASQHCLPMP